jgi:hypothetical protein
VIAKVELNNLHEPVTGPFGYASHHRANEEAGNQGYRQIDNSKSAKNDKQRERKNDNRY